MGRLTQHYETTFYSVIAFVNIILLQLADAVILVRESLDYPYEYVMLADCGQGNEVQSSQAAYYQTYTDDAPRDVARIVVITDQSRTLGNTKLWAYFTDTGINFTASLLPEGENGEYSGTAYNGYVHFACFQKPLAYIYSNGSAECYQRYNCSHAAISSTTTTQPPLSSSTHSETQSSLDIVSSPTSSTVLPFSNSVLSSTVSTTLSSLDSISLSSSSTFSRTSPLSSSIPTPPISTVSLLLNSTSSLEGGTTSLPPDNASPPPSDSGTSLLTSQIVGLVIGAALGVLTIVGVSTFAVWKWRKWKGTKKVAKVVGEQSFDTFEVKSDTSLIVEADGYPAGGELEAPLPVQELDGRSRPVEIHGFAVVELEGCHEDRVTLIGSVSHHGNCT
ncbi:hypothetical protein M434DRAFT_377815 [Hypoxylon sp. CO27-5]|nr:hypothetical protein M434DRAFT_377815 [Hypoxylon sp. CO27-5]